MPRVPLVLAALAALLLAGCATGGRATDAKPSADPPPDGAVAALPAEAQPATLVVVNRSRKTVYFVYASACSARSWGPDRLAPEEVVPPGKTAEIAVTTGCWDLRAVFGDGSDRVRRYAYIAEPRWRWTLG